MNVLCRISLDWAEDHQQACILGAPEFEFRAYINSNEGQAYWHDNRRGYDMNYEIREIMIELTQEYINTRKEGQHLSVAEGRLQREEKLKTAEGQALHVDMLMEYEAQLIIHQKRMDDGDEKNKEAGAHRIKVVEEKLRRFRAEVNPDLYVFETDLHASGLKIGGWGGLVQP